MSTNYYFKIRNYSDMCDEITHKYKFLSVEMIKERLFSDIHICKFSPGFKPLFEGSDYFKTLNELKEFYESNRDYLTVASDDGIEMDFNMFIETCIERQTDVQCKSYGYGQYSKQYRFCPANYAWLDCAFS